MTTMSSSVDKKCLVEETSRKKTNNNASSCVICSALLLLVLGCTSVLLVGLYFNNIKSFLIGIDRNGTVRVLPLHYKGNRAQASLQSDSELLQQESRKPFSFDDMYRSDFSPHLPQLAWVRGDIATYRSKNGNIMIYNATENSSKKYASATDIPEILLADSYEFSTDLKYMAVLSKTTTKDDLISLFNCSIYQIDKLQHKPSKLTFSNQNLLRQIHIFQWLKEGSSFYFVSKGNVYYQDSVEGKTIALTKDSAESGILNGVKLNIEDGFSMGAHPSFSTNNRYTVYPSTNWSTIPDFKYPTYGDNMQRYTQINSITYVKAGVPSLHPVTTVWLSNLADRTKNWQIQPPDEFRNKQHYYWRTEWRSRSTFIITWSNRRQNHSIDQLCNVQTATCEKHLEETPQGGWVDTMSSAKLFIDGGESYLTLLPKQESAETGAWRQVALVSSSVGEHGEVTFLTEGEDEVESLSGFDDQNKIVYFFATGGDSYSRKLYSVGTPAASEENRERRCLSCESCSRVSLFSISPTREFYSMMCMGPGIPETRVVKTETQKYNVVGSDYDRVRNLLDERRMPTREFIQLKVGGGYVANAEVKFPPNIDRSGVKKYPVLIYTYGGPQGHQQTGYSYRINGIPQGNFENYLSSNYDVITMRLDGRGSGGRGYKYLHELNNRMGTVEVEDQILGARSLGERYSFVDKEKIAIWGWSYGGFTTSHAIGHPSNIIRCGMAVAPVINYRLYYDGYTERFNGLDTPEDNEYGYNLTDCSRKAENFRGKEYFIAHGTGDSNVHFQHAIQMIKALTEAEIQFQTEVYVDEGHSISDRPKNRHLFRAMTEFLTKKCFV